MLLWPIWCFCGTLSLWQCAVCRQCIHQWCYQECSIHQQLCFAYAHIQNGKAEKATQDIEHIVRTMLLYAKARWTDAVHPSLWLCAMIMVVHIMNNLPDEANCRSQIEKFSWVEILEKPQHALTLDAEHCQAKKEMQYQEYHCIFNLL